MDEQDYRRAKDELVKAREELDADFAAAEAELEEELAKLRDDPGEHSPEEVEQAALQAREHMERTRAAMKANFAELEKQLEAAWSGQTA